MGEEITVEQRAKLDEALETWGEQYYKDSARNRIERGESPPVDPYRTKWLDLDLSSVCRQLDKSWTVYYDQIYRPFSGRVHWTARSLFLNVEFKDGHAKRLRTEDPHSAAVALKVGEFALFQSLLLLDWRFGLEIGEQLTTLYDEFTVEANKILARPFD